jgi:hypothetical protein
MDPDAPQLGHAVPPLVGEGATTFAARLEGWAADARVDDAARRRSHERWLLQQAEEEGSFAGVIADLAERRAHVAVHTPASCHFGQIDVVGVDFAGVRSPTGAEALVSLAAVSSLRTQPGEPLTLGDRVVTTHLSLAEVLTRLAAERERLMVGPRSGDALIGTLRSVGDDVVVLRLDGEAPAGTAYLPLQSVGEAILGI